MQNLLDRILNKESLKIIFETPPRHGKSLQNTIHFSSYYLEKNPERSVIIGAYNQTLANKFSRKARKIANGRIALSKERIAVEDWETKAGGNLRAVGVGAGIAGHGGDLILIDDPIKNREEANSKVYRERLWDWWQDDLMTRSEPNNSIILTMTRWHYDDLVGRILASEEAREWEVVRLPALAEKNDPLGRQEGVALWPERYNNAQLAKIQKRMGSSFISLYQQRPVPEGGHIFKQEWWQYYKEPPNFDYILQCWDTAAKKGEMNDYSVCTTWGRVGNRYYIIDCWRKRVEFPELRRVLLSLAEKYKPHEILIEDTSAGTALIQDLKNVCSYPIKAIKATKSKEERALAITPLIEALRVYLLENAAWLVDLLDESSVFPNGAHDDIVDTIIMALAYFREIDNKSIRLHIY